MISILYSLASIGWLVCFILVLIPLFKTKGVLHGILGILCGLYPFIWGWINAKQLNLSKVMLIWTICFVVMIFSGSVVSATAFQQIQEAAQKAQPK